MDTPVEGTPVEPVMPTVANEMPVAEEVSEYEQANPEQPVESETPETEQPETQSETPSEEGIKKEEPASNDSNQFDEIIEGWKEDRETLTNVQKELSDANAKLAKLDETSQEDYSDLSEEERIDAIVKSREEAVSSQKNQEQQATQNEIRFFERTDKYFSANKARVLDIAVKFNAQNLSQAIMIAKGQDTVGTKPNTPVKPAVPKKNAPVTQKGESSSFGDMYRQGGIN